MKLREKVSANIPMNTKPKKHKNCREKRPYTICRSGLGETMQSDNQNYAIGREQPINKETNN